MQTNARAFVLLAALNVVVVLMAPAAAANGQERKPTSTELKAKLIAVIELLETDPYNKDAEWHRAAVLEWLTNAPDVTVTLCADVLGDIKKFKDYDGSALLGQLAFSEAKFILQNPDKAADALAVNMAGVEGVLKAYAAMQKAKPRVKFDNLEKLIQLRAQNELEAHVRATVSKCH